MRKFIDLLLWLLAVALLLAMVYSPHLMRLWEEATHA